MFYVFLEKVFLAYISFFSSHAFLKRTVKYPETTDFIHHVVIRNSLIPSCFVVTLRQATVFTWNFPTIFCR